MLSLKVDQLWAAKALCDASAKLDMNGKEYRVFEFPDQITRDMKAYITKSKK